MAHPIFIISGLPRSRSAWLSNFLTAQGALCIHEGIARFESPKEAAKWYKILAETQPIGISDSGAVLFQQALQKEIPDARWVIIRRPLAECQESFKREHGLDVCLWDHKRLVDDAIHYLQPLVVDFEDIDDRADTIAEYCIPGWVRDPIRTNLLKTWDIQLTREALFSGSDLVKKSGLLDHVEKPRFSPAAQQFSQLMGEILYNAEALKWWNQLLETVDVLDHTVDGDGQDNERTIRVFKALTMEWPTNSFFLRNSSVLIPVMSAAVSAWQSGGEKEYDVYTEVSNALIYILHGQEGVDRYMPGIRALVKQLSIEDREKDGE